MNLTGSDLTEYAKSKVGTPYFYGCNMEMLTTSKAITLSKLYFTVVTPNYLAKAIAKDQINKINTDDSGLIAGYTKKNLSSSQLYSTAYMRLLIETYDNWADGVIVWRKGHVGVFYHNINGEPIVVEAKDINYGTVYSKFNPNNWTCGLTFEWMKYSYDKSASDGATYKGQNPYKEPTVILRLGSKGEGVKWLQYELTESGFDLSKHGGIDGEFGPFTLKCVEEFQEISKLEVDGEVGLKTKYSLLADIGETEE